MRTSPPVGSLTSPDRRSRTFPDFTVPTQVWQMPIRQPKASSRPACSPASKIGVAPSHSVVVPLSRKVTVPPSPASALALILGWKRS
jgi:hypothetical protein